VRPRSLLLAEHQVHRPTAAGVRAAASRLLPDSLPVRVYDCREPRSPRMIVRRFSAVVVLLSVLPSARPADPPPTLQQRLAKEPVGALARAARARGDAGRGAVLFFQPFLTCAKCHDGETGTQLGPDLPSAGKDATAEYLIESVLSPSKV